MKRFIAVVGLNYVVDPEAPKELRKEIRVEAGGEVPAEVVERSPWLLEQGYVQEG